MFEEFMKKMVTIIEPTVQDWLKQAYDCGYEIGGEDATRRMHDMYMFGRIDGYADGKAEIGEIDLDGLSPEVFDEVQEAEA